MLTLLKWQRNKIGGLGGMTVYKTEFCDGKMRCVIRNWGYKGASVELDVQKKSGVLWENIAHYNLFTVKAAKEKAEETLWDLGVFKVNIPGKAV